MVTYNGFNRYIVECKCRRKMGMYFPGMVLIDT